GGFQSLDAVRHRVEQRAHVGSATLQRSRGEEVGRVVEGRVDLLAGGKTVLGLGHHRGGALQREQVLPDAGRESDIRSHYTKPFWFVLNATRVDPFGSAAVIACGPVRPRKRTCLMRYDLPPRHFMPRAQALHRIAETRV